MNQSVPAIGEDCGNDLTNLSAVVLFFICECGGVLSPAVNLGLGNSICESRRMTACSSESESVSKPMQAGWEVGRIQMTASLQSD